MTRLMVLLPFVALLVPNLGFAQFGRFGSGCSDDALDISGHTESVSLRGRGLEFYITENDWALPEFMPQNIQGVARFVGILEVCFETENGDAAPLFGRHGPDGTGVPIDGTLAASPRPLPCTATLIEGNRLITARHCISSNAHFADLNEPATWLAYEARVTFNYRFDTNIDFADIRRKRASEGDEFADLLIEEHIANAVEQAQQRTSEGGPYTYRASIDPVATASLNNLSADIVVLRIRGGDAVRDLGGFVPLIDGTASLAANAPLVIIFHPRSQPQLVSRANCFVAREHPNYSSSRLGGNRFGHTCATLGGSSGALIFDSQMRVIGVHTDGGLNPTQVGAFNKGTLLSPYLPTLGVEFDSSLDVNSCGDLYFRYSAENDLAGLQSIEQECATSPAGSAITVAIARLNSPPVPSIEDEETIIDEVPIITDDEVVIDAGVIEQNSSVDIFGLRYWACHDMRIYPEISLKESSDDSIPTINHIGEVLFSGEVISSVEVIPRLILVRVNGMLDSMIAIQLPELAGSWITSSSNICYERPK